MDLSKYDHLNSFTEVYHMKKGDFMVNWILIRSADITNSSPKSLEFTISQSEIQKRNLKTIVTLPGHPKLLTRLLQDKNVSHFTSLLLHIYFYVKSLTTHLVSERSSSKSNFTSMSPFFYMLLTM